MERKLVTIQTIDNLISIDGADKIELAQILGWQAIVSKGKHKVGDKVVWFEIDSFLPIHPRYEFLRKGCYKNTQNLGEGFRIKSMRMKGVVSQGLVMSLDDMGIYQELNTVWKCTDAYSNQYYISPEGDDDLSEMFGIQKYEKPIPVHLQGKIKGNFPSYIPKTDQSRLENLIKRHKEDLFNGMLWEATLKLDGTSATYFKYQGNFGVCSRNLELKLEDTSNTYVKFGLENNLDKLIPDGYVLQGELMGPSIQENREKLFKVKLFVFDIFNIEEQRYLTPDERGVFFFNNFGELFDSSKNIEHIPVLGHYFMEDSETFVKDMKKLADETKSINNPIAEGIVFKREDGNFSFKVISPKFLCDSEE